MNDVTRADLIEERKRLKPGIWDNFAPSDGYCYRCRADLVSIYGDKYPHADITGCPKCKKSYCE